jgi:serine/threonine-protein kinase HipA
VKRAKVFVDGIYAGDLEEIVKNKDYRFVYREGYAGGSVSLTMPTHQRVYTFDRFPPFFEGLLPEGPMLGALLKKRKLDADNYFDQLVQVGKEMVGNVTVERDS